MKRMKRMTAIMLSLVIVLGLFSGCGKVANAEAYMTKGEFMLLFTSEIGLTASSNSDVKLDLDEENKFYSAAVALVEIGFMTPEEAVEELDKAVTKETVATLCVYNLFFRDTYDITLKDEGKLKDAQACKDAVGHGIVSISNGYFKAYQKMTYEECQHAIDTMMHIDATSSFEAGEAEIEVVLKENVIDITEEYDDSTLQVVDPMDENFEEIVRGMSTEDKVDDSTEVSCSDEENMITLFSNDTEMTIPEFSGVTSNFPEQGGATANLPGQDGKTSFTTLDGKTYCSMDEAKEGDLVVIRIQKFASNQRIYKVGDMIAYGIHRFDTYNEQKLRNYMYAFYGEVVAVNDNMLPTLTGAFTYYTIRIPSEEEVLASAELNRYNSAENGAKWSAEQLEKSFDGLSIGNFEVTKDGIKLKISEKAENSVDSWRDAKFEVDMNYEFEIKDISLDVSGFGGVLTGDIEDAICKLNYTVVNHFDAETELRYTPDNNRNGKFLNNLKRSRFTGANAAGAKAIKIARLYTDIGYGFNVELYVYLTIEVDGSIGITIENAYANGFKVKNNKVTKIAEKTTQMDLDANVNAEAGIHFDFSLRWVRRKGTPWADFDAEVGLGAELQSKVFVLGESHVECVETQIGYVSNAELSEIQKVADIDYCFDGRLYAYAEVSGLNSDTKIGKVIRWFDEDFSLSWRDDWTILEWHLEDGSNVGECTRDYEGQEEEEASKSEDATFELTVYKVTIPEYTCGMVMITGYPVDEEDLEKLGGITVTVQDTDIATAHINGNRIIIEAGKEGSTQLVIETKNKRFRQECSVTIEKNVQ